MRQRITDCCVALVSKARSNRLRIRELLPVLVLPSSVSRANIQSNVDGVLKHKADKYTHVSLFMIEDTLNSELLEHPSRKLIETQCTG